jgi:hypothetical protein
VVCYISIIECANYNNQKLTFSTFSDSTKDITVTYSTRSDPGESICQYALHADKEFAKAIGDSTSFVDGGSEKRSQFIHKVHNLQLLK